MSFFVLAVFALIVPTFVLIYWFPAATIRFSVSLFKSPFWTQTSLVTSSVCLKYWPCKAFFSQSYNLFSFFFSSKTLAASEPSTLSFLAACIGLSSLPWKYTSKPLIAKSTQSSIAIKPLYPSFRDIPNLPTSDFGCNPPYIVKNVLVFLPIACNSHFYQLINVVEYLKRDITQVLTSWIKSPSSNCDLITFLIY